MELFDRLWVARRLKGCDYRVAAMAIVTTLKGKDLKKPAVIPNELARLLDALLAKPGFNTACSLMAYDEKFAVFFYESKPGGIFYRQFQA